MPGSREAVQSREKAKELAAFQESTEELLGEAAELQQFFGFVENAEETDALDNKTKELMSLAIGVVLRCGHCILWHVDAALEAGATYDEIIDALKVAVVMGGGPAQVYAVEAYETLQALEAEHE
ncbi:MAG: AhpD family alkylhydroperoxidase [Halobacteriales archaeon]|jgi:AhpD family alkylhydroperoxidase